MGQYDQAVILGQLEKDRWNRFRNFAGPNVRETIDESERMRNDFMRHVQVMFTSDNDSERSKSTAWVAKHAADVAHLCAFVRAMYERFLRVDFESTFAVITETEKAGGR